MAAVVPENLRMLLTQYTFETDADSMREDLTCTLCSKLMIDAYETVCGCQYCRECLVGYLSEGNNYCRGDKEECQEERLLLDDNVSRIPSLNRKILRVRVHCPNRPCVFISPLAVMDDHLRVCGQQALECPYTTIGCGSEGASKDRMETHMINETLVHSRLLMEAINNLRNELGGVREDLRLSKLEVASVREELRKTETARRGDLEHLEEEMRLLSEEREELLGQMKAQKEENKRVLVIGLEAQANEIKELKMNVKSGELKMLEGLSMMAELAGAVATMRKELDRGREEKIALEAEVETVRAALVEYNEDDRGRTEAMRTVLQGEKRAASVVREERMRIDELAMTVDTLNVGTNVVVAVGRLYFTVDRWAARVGEGKVVWSPHVYSHANGYKLQLNVYPGGDNGRGKHVSVYAVVCRGEYDAVLPWPCTHTVTVSVVNQGTKEAHTTQTLTYCSVNKKRFSRPIGIDNPPYGWDSFVSHAALRSTKGLVVNDSVLLLVVVAPSPVDVVEFTVDRFSARRAANETVWSPHFYSHVNGHKLRVRVDPGARGNGRGTHVSVSSVVCKGENDDALVWPCRYGVAISLVNQRSNEAHVTMTVTPCTVYQRYFNKPIGTYNASLEWSSYISHADLDATDGLVVNDSVLLRIALIAPQ